MSTEIINAETFRAGDSIVRPVAFLTFKPKQSFFNANRVVSAQRAGFAWSKSRVSAMALLDTDTERDIATLHVDGFREAIGQLALIELRCDPEQCPVEHRAGTRLIEACRNFAALMDAVICDASEQEISDEALADFAVRVDAIMKRRSQKEESAVVRVQQPDGSFRVGSDLSFVASYYSKRGKYLRTDFFDVPPMDYFDGWIAGYELARELLEFKQTHKRTYVDVASILSAAGAIRSEGRGSSGKQKRHVAKGFLRVMEEMLSFAARNANHGKWIDGQIANQRAYQESEAQTEAEKKRAFVARMKEAKMRRTAAEV